MIIGDVLCIYCCNNVDLVSLLLKRLKIDGSKVISIENISKASTERLLPHIASPASIFKIFQYCIDIRAIPKPGLVKGLSHYCSNLMEEQEMLRLAKDLTDKGKKIKEGTILDILGIHTHFFLFFIFGVFFW